MTKSSAERIGSGDDQWNLENLDSIIVGAVGIFPIFDFQA